MKKIENECISCPKEMGCMGDSCPYKNVTRFYCDICGDEATLYHYEDKELCADCIVEQFDMVDGSEIW